MQIAKRHASPLRRAARVRAVAGAIVSDLGRPAIRPVAWPLWAVGLALLMRAMFRAPTKPVSVVEIQAAYEIVLMSGVLTGAAFVRASSTGSYRALLAGSNSGATRLGWIVSAR